MKALTLTQPWASLVAIGAKRIETRSWQTKYCGPLAIHAAKTIPNEVRGWWSGDVLGEGGQRAREALRAAGVPLWFDLDALPRGAVVATAVLADVLPIFGKPDPLPEGQRCVGLDPEDIVRVWRPGEFPTGYPMHTGDGGWAPDRENGFAAEHEAAFGDYSHGRFAWLLDDAVALDEPVPVRGSLGLWEWQR